MKLITKIFKAIDQLGNYEIEKGFEEFDKGYNSAREGCKEVIKEILEKKK